VNPGAGEKRDAVRRVLERHGLRCTRQRECVYRTLLMAGVHPTAEELHKAVGMCADGPGGLSLATVYNTLEVFTKRGLVRRIRCGSGPCRYDAITRDHVHITLVDGRVLDLPDDLSARLVDSLPPGLLLELEERLGVRVDGVSIQIQAAEDPTPGANRGDGANGRATAPGDTEIAGLSDCG
jgi:Fur family iron response transcriptional regulator